LKLACPGSTSFKNPTPEDIECVFCGFINEIWTDEIEIKCKKCKKPISRDISNTCLMWCQKAGECIGEEKLKKIMKKIKKK
jgi:hypothetical protein